MPDMQDSPPPKGDFQKAEKYVSSLVRLLDQDKIKASKTDLRKFNPSSLQDHYRLDLNDYLIEISHSTHPDSDEDSYVIIFTNLRQIADGASEKVVLAYMNLTEEQYKRIAEAASDQVEKSNRAEEAQRLEEALEPIDQILASAESEPAESISDHQAKELPKHHNSDLDQEQFHLN